MKKSRTDTLRLSWKRSLNVVLAGVLCVSMVCMDVFEFTCTHTYART